MPLPPQPPEQSNPFSSIFLLGPLQCHPLGYPILVLPLSWSDSYPFVLSLSHPYSFLKALDIILPPHTPPLCYFFIRYRDTMVFNAASKILHGAFFTPRHIVIRIESFLFSPKSLGVIPTSATFPRKIGFIVHTQYRTSHIVLLTMVPAVLPHDIDPNVSQYFPLSNKLEFDM